MWWLDQCDSGVTQLGCPDYCWHSQSVLPAASQQVLPHMCKPAACYASLSARPILCSKTRRPIMARCDIAPGSSQSILCIYYRTLAAYRHAAKASGWLVRSSWPALITSSMWVLVPTTIDRSRPCVQAQTTLREVAEQRHPSARIIISTCNLVVL